MANDRTVICQECGMPCGVTEFHPMAACLMFKGCHSSDKVRANLAALASHTGEAEPTVFIDFKQATDLIAMFGGEPNEITLQVSDGHSGRGMYASYTDMPEEGTIFLGNSDQEAMPDTPSAATPAAPGEVTEQQLIDGAFFAFSEKSVQIVAQIGTWSPTNVLTNEGKELLRSLNEVRAALSHPAPVAAPALASMVVTEDMHVAAVKVLQRASGLDGLPQRMLDAMLAVAASAAPAPASEAPSDAMEVAQAAASRIEEVAAKYASRTEFGEVIFPEQHWMMFVADLATTSTGDSADAPVQQAGEAFPGDLCLRCYGSGKDPAPEVGRADALKALQEAHRLGFLRAAGWVQRDDLFADVSSPTYRKDRDHDLAALKGEQPVEPSGSADDAPLETGEGDARG